MHRLRLFALALALCAPAPALAADGAALYASNCAGCHGPDGKAQTPAAASMKVPAIAGKSAQSVVEVVKSNAKHAVPAAKLSAEELQAIGEYLASL